MPKCILRLKTFEIAIKPSLNMQISIHSKRIHLKGKKGISKNVNLLLFHHQIVPVCLEVWLSLSSWKWIHLQGKPLCEMCLPPSSIQFYSRSKEIARKEQILSLKNIYLFDGKIKQKSQKLSLSINGGIRTKYIHKPIFSKWLYVDHWLGGLCRVFLFFLFVNWTILGQMIGVIFNKTVLIL